MSDRWLPFLLGALFVGHLAAALFFFKFWRRTRDRLFLGFAVAFAVLSGLQIGFLELKGTEHAHIELYGVRLAAYSLILIAIIDKNRR